MAVSGTVCRAWPTVPVLAVGALLASPATAAGNANGNLLSPSSPWRLDYDRDRCVMSRRFGSENDPYFLQFIRYEPSDGFAFNLIGRRFATVDNRPDLRIRFGSGGTPVKVSTMTGRLGDLPMIFASARLDNLDWNEDKSGPPPAVPPTTEAAVTEVQVALKGQRLTFKLGPMDRPMAAMRRCEADLVRSWGLDPQVQAALATRVQPATPPYRWLQTEDYPEGMLLAGQQAIIAFRLMVDLQGKPTACSVQANIARDKTFAETTCKALMRRARFTPARSATGDAVASFYASRVNWVIP